MIFFYVGYILSYFPLLMMDISDNDELKSKIKKM